MVVINMISTTTSQKTLTRTKKHHSIRNFLVNTAVMSNMMEVGWIAEYWRLEFHIGGSEDGCGSGG